MKPKKFIPFVAIFLASVLSLTGCSSTVETQHKESTDLLSYGPKTFNPNYVDDTEKINALDAPVAKSIDDVKPNQYVMVTLDNTILSGLKEYQPLYDGSTKSMVMMTKENALKLESSVSGVIVEPNMEIKTTEEANTTQSGGSLSQWGLDRIDQQSLPLDDSYTYGNDASGVTAYIVDSGIRTTHQDFTGRISKGFDTIGDGNGYSDCLGHGTHVAGIIGGTSYGVAKKVSLVPVRVFACTNSASGTNLVNGLNWIKANHSGGPAVVNLSLGGAGVSSGWATIINDMVANGFVMVVSAGNDSADACNYSPAYVPNAITVGATTNTDGLAYFSNYGSCVDILAPGSSITSDSYSSDSGNVVMSGTSMAAPHVTGAVARILQKNPTYTVAQASSDLIAMAASDKISSVKTGTPNNLLNIDATFAAGALMSGVESLPSSPQILATKIVNVNGLPQVHFYGKHGSTGVTSYNVTIKTAGTDVIVKTQGFSSVSLTQPLDLALDGLTNNTSYDAYITSMSSVGASQTPAKTTFTVVM